MGSNKKYLLYIGVFALFILLGFGVSKLIKGCGKSADSTVVSSGLTTTRETKNKEPKPDSTEPIVQPEPAEIKIVVDKIKQNGNSYTLQVHAENLPETVTPLYKIDQIGRKSTDGQFTKIPGIQSGKYIIKLVDSTTGEELASLEVPGFDVIKPDSEKTEPAVSGMSAGEFQSLLLNQSDNSLLGGKNPKVARTVYIRTQGMNDGEKAPGDVLAVREKIANGIWTSARVLSVGYDQSGRINSATIQPVY